MIDPQAPRFNGHPVAEGFAPTLQKVMDGLTPGEAKAVKRSCSQGWSQGRNAWSGATHADGYAVDFLTKTWSDALVRKVVGLFQQCGCQAVLRVPGEDLGPGVAPVAVQHLHVVANGHGNAGILAIVTGPHGPRNLEREILKRK